jgi:26S proteasome regulatory subunit N2
VLYEDEAFPERQLAALLLSRVHFLLRPANVKMYFHLSDYDQAMSFALGAGDLFDLSEKSEFVETIIGNGPLNLRSFPSTLRRVIHPITTIFI